MGSYKRNFPILPYIYNSARKEIRQGILFRAAEGGYFRDIETRAIKGYYRETCNRY